MKRTGLWIGLFMICCLLGACNNRSSNQMETTSSTMNSIITKQGLLTVVYFDTGKSDAMLIHIDGFSMFIDTGDADDVDNYDAVMKELGITRLDDIVLTHLDADHIGGAAYLIDHYEVGAVIQPAYTEKSPEYEAYISAMKQRSYKPQLLTETKSFQVGESKFTLLPAEKKSYSNVNNYSIVTSVTYHSRNFLFCGDASKKRIEELLPLNLGHFTVYKVPHHGFYNEEQKALIDAVTPEYAVITNRSLDNISSEVLDALKKEGAKIFYTYLGNVVFQTDGTSLKAAYVKAK